MTIKFVCSCGKHLRARDEMARRRSVCPRCGQPVGVPSGEPTHTGTDASPLTPSERARLATRLGETAAATADPEPSDEQVGAMMRALLAERRTHGSRRLSFPGERWTDYLAYPFHEWRLWAASAGILTVLSVAGVGLAPVLLAMRTRDTLAGSFPWLVSLLGLWVAGYPCNFLRQVLCAAAAGDGADVRWPGAAVGPALAGALIWLGCFLAGPAVFAGLAAVYWLECGDPGLVDWLILGELGLFTVGYGLLALAAVSESGRLRDANPVHVIDLAHRLGWRAGAAAVAGFAIVAGHGWLASLGTAGGLLLPLYWVSALYWAMVLFRLLGVWCYRSRTAAVRQAGPHSATAPAS